MLIHRHRTRSGKLYNSYSNPTTTVSTKITHTILKEFFLRASKLLGDDSGIGNGIVSFHFKQEKYQRFFIRRFSKQSKFPVAKQSTLETNLCSILVDKFWCECSCLTNQLDLDNFKGTESQFIDQMLQEMIDEL